MNKSITESYFGAEIEPVNIIDTMYGKIYVGLLKNDFIFYNEIGNDPMSLSSINIKNIVWLIENHMRMHQYDNMRKSKQDLLNSHECFYYLKLLAKMDDMCNEEFNDKNIQ